MSCALLAATSWSAEAAELGEPRVSSFIGQPLVADIELTMLEDAANPVQVRLAHPNVYRGANIGMPAVLSSLRMSVMQRDGRQFLHITSLG
ncbi:FimV family protein, partial [Massilia sp. BSC265]|uniref:type IV pilus assembly protein FimV n=1 Tax=Massilia sp. BSC265 TaxID=1549812 RepID=UPI00055E9EA3